MSILRNISVHTLDFSLERKKKLTEDTTHFSVWLYSP
jgi:hypothetical protein